MKHFITSSDEINVVKMAKTALLLIFSRKKAAFTRNSQSFFDLFKSKTVTSTLNGYSDHFYLLSSTLTSYWNQKPILNELFSENFKCVKWIATHNISKSGKTTPQLRSYKFFSEKATALNLGFPWRTFYWDSVPKKWWWLGQNCGF